MHSFVNTAARKAVYNHDSTTILTSILNIYTSSSPEHSSGHGKSHPLCTTHTQSYLAFLFFTLPSLLCCFFFPLKALENTLKCAGKPSKKEWAVILVKTRNFSTLLNHLVLQGQRNRSDSRLVSSYPSCEQIALRETIPLALTLPLSKEAT